MQEVWKGKRSESIIQRVSFSSVCEADNTRVPGKRIKNKISALESKLILLSVGDLCCRGFGGQRFQGAGRLTRGRTLAGGGHERERGERDGPPFRPGW